MFYFLAHGIHACADSLVMKIKIAENPDRWRKVMGRAQGREHFLLKIRTHRYFRFKLSTFPPCTYDVHQNYTCV